MPVTIEVTLPERVFLSTGSPPSEATTLIKRELAASFFQRGALGFGQARELAELSVWEFLDLLRDRKIPLHYGQTEYEEDTRTIQELL